MKRYILTTIFAVLFAVSFVSCVKDEVYDPVKGEEGKNVDPTGPYLFSISAGRERLMGEDADTRATLNLNNYNYYWNTNEQVALTVTNQGTTTILAGMKNIPLTKTNSDDMVLHTNFWGDITPVQYTALSEGSTFDYYSYYSNGVAVNDANFPNNITFELAATYSLTPNTFDAAKTPMVGKVLNRGPNILFLENHDVTHADNPIHFDYDHTTSYAAIEFDVQLLPGVKITSLTMTVGSSLTNATRISGTYNYDVINGAGSLSGGGHSVTIAIPGGMNIGNGEKLYIPMPVKSFVNQTFTFTFTTTGGTSGNSYGTTTVSGIKSINFERGKIHPIRIAPPVARYTVNESFTVTQDGYYYIEAWGGDGGGGGIKGSGQGGDGGSDGGVSVRASGLYKLTAGQTMYIYIGAKGGDGGGGSGNHNVGVGGSNSSGFGSGGIGAAGRDNSTLLGRYFSGAGGGGGAATFISTANNISASLICSGGAGGGGGSNSTLTSRPGGAGGDGNGGNGTSGSGGSGSGGTAFTVDTNGGDGKQGGDGGLGGGGGGSGGGGGGGYQGGEGGGGGNAGASGASHGGGGGRGGNNFVTTQDPKPGYITLPNNSRPTNRKDGYVVITYFREQ